MISYRSIGLTYTVILASGLHIGTGYGLANLVDERTTRGPHALGSTDTRMPYIPGASMKGRLRMHADRLVPIFCPKDGSALRLDLFGSAQHAGRLMFSDAHLVQLDRLALDQGVGSEEGEYIEGALLPYLALEERARAALSPQRHTALTNRLVRFEAASPGLTLRGTIRGWLPEARAEAALALLTLAARALTHIGGHKGRGLGAVMLAVEPIIDDAPANLAALVEKLL